MSQIARRALAVAALAGLAPLALADTTWAPPMVYPTAPAPNAIASGDCDADGDLDLVVAFSNHLALFRNTGDGVFAAPITIPLATGSGAGDLVFADFNGDRYADIAVIHPNVQRVQLLINNQNLTFAWSSNVAAGSGPVALAAADIDGDLDLDLGIANRLGNTVSLLRNDGGTLTPWATIPVGIAPTDLVFGFFTPDPAIDMAVSNATDRTVGIYMSAGKGDFFHAMNASTGTAGRPGALALADLDGDDLPDLAVGLSGDGMNHVGVVKNFVCAFFMTADFPTGGVTPVDLTLADFDRDGDLDVAAVNTDSGTLSVLSNSGAGEFGAPQVIPIGANAAHLVAGLLDRNGSPDLAVTARGAATLTILRNLAPAPCRVDLNADFEIDFADLQTFIGLYESGAIASDFNNDGELDFGDIETFLAEFNAGC